MNPPVLLYVLKTLLTLLHPFVPFVTETIWTHLEPKNLLIAEPWPKAGIKPIFAKEEKEFEAVIDLISAIRIPVPKKASNRSRKSARSFMAANGSRFWKPNAAQSCAWPASRN